MTYLESIRANDTADFCIRIMEQSLNRANALRAPRHSPSGLSQSSLSQAQPSVGFRKDDPIFCIQCDEAFVHEDGLCRGCWNEANGQFGVGA